MEDYKLRDLGASHTLGDSVSVLLYDFFCFLFKKMEALVLWVIR